MNRSALIALASLTAALALPGCAIHHVTPYVPDAANAPLTAGAAEASASCFEASTPAETAICAAPALAAPNREMIAALQAGLRVASIFGRDSLLASQRAWLLALPVTCRLPDAPATAPAGAVDCLQAALGARMATLRAWPAPQPMGGSAIAQYVHLAPPSGAGARAGAGARPGAAFCASFAQRANDTLRRTGTLDPAAMGYAEIAGTHGASAAPPISVELYDANVFALFQRRARALSIGGQAVITPVSLTRLVEQGDTANQGGRFSSFASQTGDYASLDAFSDGTRRLALAADAWGSTAPAAPGEAAHAGIWDISGATALPVCLFDTYTRPAEPGVFDTLTNLATFRAALAEIAASADPPLGNAFRRDQAQLAADADFIVLHMPLLAIRQAAGARTAWLRARHDAVLDALFAWSAQNPANKQVFDRAFAALRPAAEDLVRAYQTSQALTGAEASQAGAVAVMELLYQASVTVAPGLGAAPEMNGAYRPRYPVLASPS